MLKVEILWRLMISVRFLIKLGKSLSIVLNIQDKYRRKKFLKSEGQLKRIFESIEKKRYRSIWSQKGKFRFDEISEIELALEKN